MLQTIDWCKTTKQTLLGLMFLALLASPVTFIFAHDDDDSDFNHCSSELKLGHLVVKKIKAHCEEANIINAHKIHADKECTKHLEVTDKAHVDDLDAQSICANSINSTSAMSDGVSSNHLNVWKDACVGSLDAQLINSRRVHSGAVSSDFVCTNVLKVVDKICAPDLTIGSTCANNLNANNACINTLNAGSFLQCGRYRATMTFATNQTYTLGSLINWDTILDDPNNNVSLSPNTTYTAPVSGYYTLLLQLDQQDIQGALAILGVPVANLQLLVNGVLFRQTYIPFLTFSNSQKATVSGLISLKAGDVVTSAFNVLVMQDSVGLADYVGTVNIIGTGSEENGSVFKIHLLSQDCPNFTPCPACTGATGCSSGGCPSRTTPCTSVQVAPCTPVGPNPCPSMSCPTPNCNSCPTGSTGASGSMGTWRE